MHEASSHVDRNISSHVFMIESIPKFAKVMDQIKARSQGQMSFYIFICIYLTDSLKHALT